MSEWKTVQAGAVVTQRKDVVTLEPGVEYRTMGVRWYGKGAYGRGMGSTETIKAKRLFRAHEGDFVFNRIDTQNGAFDVVPAELHGAFATNEFPLYVPDPDRLLSRFLLLYFQQRSVLGRIDAMRAGSEGRSRWKEADFEAWRIPLPSLTEQRRIVDTASALDAQIEALEAEADAGHNYCSIQRSQLVTTPEGREETPLGEVIEVHHGWAFPASGCRPPLGDGTPRLIRIGNFARNRRSHFDPGRSDEFTGDYPERFLLSAGDLLVVMTCQTPDGAILGWPMLVPPAGGPYLHNQRIGRVEVTAADRIDLRYAYHIFRSDHLNRALSVTAAGTKVLHTSPTKILEVPVFLPPLDEQKRVADALDALDENVQQCETELAHLRSFRSALLTSLLNQEIEIPESYDELLEEVS